MFWAVAAREELLPHELQPAEPEPVEADVTVALELREERFDLLPLSLCAFEL
jgi:hypothetical protein